MSRRKPKDNIIQMVPGTKRTGRKINPDELVMLTDFKNNVLAANATFISAQNMFVHAMEQLRRKYKFTEMEVIAEDGQIVSLPDDAIKQLT